MSTVTISIPPFPSQDLAKLVLGYLAEEQLMTAYDEFLQASPYLDAFRNEYDRIFMTSLKNILAEYRAVKIYVETCKPFILRRKLFQCPNLLEIVKFLVNNVDINKLHLQEGNGDKVGQRQHSLSRSNICEVCSSPKLLACACRSNSQSTSQIEATTLESSVETTSLADLPGNTLHKKKTEKTSDSGSTVSHSITSSDQSRDVSVNTVKCPDNFAGTNIESSHTVDDAISSVGGKSYFHSPNLLVKDSQVISHSPYAGQSIHVANSVSHSSNENGSKQQNYVDVSSVCKTVCGAGTFQDFSTGVDSSTINKIIVPDSSTSENNNIQPSTSETESIRSSNNNNARPQLLIKVSHDHTNTSIQGNKTLSSFTKLTTKESIVKSNNNLSTQNEISPKITILSDIKVDSEKTMPPVLKTATSTPLLQMQTIYINGTPAYKQAQQSHQNYTKDEIMAMPTIILVPATGTSKKTVPSVTQNNQLQNKEYPAVTCSTSENLEPLIIDVSTPDTPGHMDNDETSDNNLVKTVEAPSHMSLPKENNLPSVKTNTPHVLPPTRKSSSTPRRTSHIRVLDFATPRRILHETINEQGEVKHVSSNEATQSEISDFPIINTNNTEESQTKINTNLGNANFSEETNNSTAKENKTTLKLYNWDTQLRALAYAGNGNIQKSETTQKSKSKKAKKKVSPKGDDNGKSKDPKRCSKNINEKETNTPKNKNTKSRKKSFEITKDIDNVNDAQDKVSVPTIPVKPTINIISRNKWIEPVETEKPPMKSNNSDENLDTPELERMSLHNEIGARLNISDLLETPYKQALYDIQMETPKFLGPDIPDDPLSDIKIMSIPTPRFLNTPKLTQNTPSSYSSRPTDYSSGGSYYKPDDQDYVLATEVMECALSDSRETKKTNKESTTSKIESVTERVDEGKSRPVRQCTKNVSYNYSSNVVSTKYTDISDDKTEKSSTCSDMSVNKSDKVDKLKISKSDKDNKSGKKSEPKRKSKKYKSPTKKETPKSFTKIKPRQTTPVKVSLGRARKKSDISQSPYIKHQPKKTLASKQKKSIVPELVPVLTKSRRKSSTPRKLNCTKIFNAGSTELNVSDSNITEPSPEIERRSASEVDSNNHCNQDLETEQLILRWSDDCSQESAPKKIEDNINLANESDDITKIKEYINNTKLPTETRNSHEGEGTLQDLIKRGFDVATARMIERDLLEVPNQIEPNHQRPIQLISQSIPSPVSHIARSNESKTKSDKINESDSSTVNNLQICIEDDNDEFDLSVHESNEDTNNYFSFQFNEATFVQSDQIKLKETFSMEICIEDDESIRLRAMPFSVAFEQKPQDEKVSDCHLKPSEGTGSSCNFDTLYTPRKAQCYELFDSTLASLDTPLKSNSPKSQECETVSEIVLEVEKLETDTKQKPDNKKRKRFQSESVNCAKKAKTDNPYLLNSAIQNIDIETVLSKLHGP